VFPDTRRKKLHILKSEYVELQSAELAFDQSQEICFVPGIPDDWNKSPGGIAQKIVTHPRLDLRETNP